MEIVLVARTPLSLAQCHRDRPRRPPGLLGWLGDIFGFSPAASGKFCGVPALCVRATLLCGGFPAVGTFCLQLFFPRIQFALAAQHKHTLAYFMSLGAAC